VTKLVRDGVPLHTQGPKRIDHDATGAFAGHRSEEVFELVKDEPQPQLVDRLEWVGGLVVRETQISA
jgi:hypothetical protein